MSFQTTNNREARLEILAAIRQNLAASVEFDAVHHEHQVHQQKTSVLLKESSFIENAPLALPTISLGETLTENFRDALTAIGGNCAIVRNETEAVQIVQQLIEAKKPQRIAVTDSLIAKNVSASLKTDAEFLEKASAAELFNCDFGITGAQWAIAETGTLVLVSDKEFHRLASLVPPFHVCLIRADCIRQTLGEILELLNKNGRDDLSRTITFVTGPSRTSDIELTLAIGVHGPAELHVIVIDKEFKDNNVHG